MALHIVASRPDPALLTLPWATPLEAWAEHVVDLPRGLSRHVVRIVELGSRTYAVKETEEQVAFREYRLLRDLQRLGLPAVVPQGVVTGRADTDGDPLPAVLLTEHLRFSLPYRRVVGNDRDVDHGATLPSLVDALVVLLVRLHLADFYWGDVSLSNALFRRDAGGFAAYLVDAETGELQPTLSPRLREHDVVLARENVFAELLDLQADTTLDADVVPHDVVALLAERYDALWSELTDAEEFGTDEMWRIEQRIERLNDLGFDVDELDIVTDLDGDVVRLQPKAVELGHHRRELRALTGLDLEDAQARRMLNDLAAFTAYHHLGRQDRAVVAARWLTEVWERIATLVPEHLRTTLEPAEFFHDVLVHRWYLSEHAGHEVDLWTTADDYVATVLRP